MGGATAEGLLRGETFKNEDITIADPAAAVLERFSALGASVTSDNQTAAEGADIVCVVVKPWLVEGVIRDIKPVLNYQRQLLIVIAAGITSEQLKTWLAEGADGSILPTFLVIPNIAIAQQQSMTFVVPVSAQPSHTKLVKDLFDELGTTIVTEERLLGAGTTLASCGIAYAMRYIRAASEGGVELGFRAADAQQIVMQTVRGAVELLQDSGLHPEAAIDLVTTPGGLTIRGLNEMEHAGFTSSVIRGLKAGIK